jgi:hypothetical protein
MAFLTAILLPACRTESGSGNIITGKRNTGAFSGVSVSGGFEVEIKNGDKEEVTVEADDNLMDHIQTRVTDGTLRINLDKINVNNAHLKVYITAPVMDNVTASAAANIKTLHILTSPHSMTFEASSGGNITAEVNAPKIFATSSSGGEVELSGHTRDFNASTSSGSSITASQLLTENTVIEASSGATAKVHASVNLTAEASSGASIGYRGAANVKKTVSSGADVNKED